MFLFLMCSLLLKELLKIKLSVAQKRFQYDIFLNPYYYLVIEHETMSIL